MATTNKNLMAWKANRIDPKTVAVGDRVKWGRTSGTVVFGVEDKSGSRVRIDQVGRG